MPVASSLPRWDLSPYFNSADSREFQNAMSGLQSSLDRAEELWDRENVTKGGVPEKIVLENVLETLNKLIQDATLLGTYLECLVTTDSRDELAAAKLSEFDMLSIRYQKLRTRFSLWVSDLDIEAITAESPASKEHEFALQQAKLHAIHLMDPRIEALVSDLSLSGSTAWSRLHSNLTSQIMVEVDGESLAMPSVRNIAYDKDRDRRKRAYDAELAAWKKNELPIAACLNGIKGEVNTLCQSRKWENPLDSALFNANIDRATLEAMMSAAHKSFPVFRRYMDAKARALGIKKLAFYDIFAPVGEGTKAWSYEEGCEFVAENFARYSSRMGDFARRTYREQWIDAEPRNGKVGGAYCATIRDEESRILMNYDPSYGSVSTLAHELGHAYHALCLKDRSPMNRDTPMTVAETASIFCETIVKEAALGSVGESDQLVILEASLQNQCQVVVDITSRFLFEQSVFAKRVDRELSANEFSGLMLDAQKQTYGDGLDQDLLHPYMWAVKPHYYSAYSFYNFPYMYGLLFGLGLYTIYQQDPSAFKEGYDDLLSSTGLADAPTLAMRFGIDVRSEGFWQGSLAQIAADVDRFEALTK